MSMPKAQAGALEYRDAFLSGGFSAVEGTTRYLERLVAVDRKVHALRQIFSDSAMAAAREVDARRARGEKPRPLEGVPFTAKVNISTIEGETNAGSRILAGFQSPVDATAVQRLRHAGAILVGKTNQDEFGMGGSTEHAEFPTHNPWDLERVPGGSSGGAAALAGALGWGVHLGSDTGGSVRQPASYCGCTGFKPTYGRISRSGLIAFGSSFDQIGPLTTNALDAEAVFRVMAGYDALDSTSRAESVEPSERSDRSSRPRRIGVAREFSALGVDKSVSDRVDVALQAWITAGAEVVEVDLPMTEYANACYQVISTAEAASNLSRYDGMRFGQRVAAGSLDETYRQSRSIGFGEEVKRRILLGTFVLSSGYYDAYYTRALKVRQRIRQDFDRVFGEVDLVVGPTAPNVAFPIGEKVSDPLELYACDVLTVSASLGGLPAISIPAGVDDQGLPVGLQIMGPELGDSAVLGLARQFQSLTAHHLLRSPLVQDGDL